MSSKWIRQWKLKVHMERDMTTTLLVFISVIYVTTKPLHCPQFELHNFSYNCRRNKLKFVVVIIVKLL